MKSNIQHLVQEKKEIILKIAYKHGAKNIRIFGSVLHGSNDANSDLDLLVDTTDNISSWFPAGLIIELENLLHIKVDVVTSKSLKQRIRAKILAEAKLI